jgi:GT2 family glycosyltransferase
MPHSVSVVIPVWNEWHHTKNCLETLRPTLGLHDEVIVVDNGSRDETPKALKQFEWVKVITNEENEGFAKGCNKGAAAATKDLVCFLNNDTILPAKWIDGLTWPFDDPTVFATGPRSNAVSGPQCVSPLEVTYTMERMSDFRKWARDWRESRRGQTSEISRLVGFCVMVRRDKLEEIGGFDEQFEIGGYEDDDLSRRLIQAGGRLLVCDESFVHHINHATFDGNGVNWQEKELENRVRFLKKHNMEELVHAAGPATNGDVFVSACMIVKDEIDNLDRCLTALNGVVDEVVVYDTGSTDGSIELARAAGARVIEGYWDDDFGRARNAALAECKGTWILHVDADEVFEGDARSLRQFLDRTDASALQMEILNLSDGDKNNLTHRPCRLFKRDIYHWQGRLHEQVTMRDGKPRNDFGVAPFGRLLHYGYMQEAMRTKNKVERNIRISQVDAEDDNGRDMVDKLTNLGRSLMLGGQFEEALSLFTKANTMHTESPVVKRTLYRAAAQASIASNHPADALTWVEELSAASHFQDTSHYFRGQAYCGLEQWEDALEELNQLHDIKDDDGVLFPMFVADVCRTKALAGLQRWPEAADAVARFAKEDANDEPVWGLAVETFWRAGRSIDELLQSMPAKHLNSIFGQLTTIPAEAADAALEGLWKFDDRRASVLALAIRVAPKLAVERSLEWSNRLREYKLSEHCPLVATAYDTSKAPRDRLLAAAIAVVAFDDQRGRGALRMIAASYPSDRFAEALVTINDLSPDLLESFVQAASVTPARSFDMARVLHELGASDEGAAVLVFGMKGAGAASLAEEAAAWLESTGHGSEAASVRSAVKS